MMKWTNQLASHLNWSGDISNKEEKQQVADQVAGKVRDGDVIGIGSGSTAFLALQAIVQRVKEEGIDVKGIPTSKEAELNCSVLGLPTTTLIDSKPDWGFDGADEVDGEYRLIKGRGGAMLREKLVMASAEKTYILVDQSKIVTRLGEKFAVPVEVDARAIHLVESKLEAFSGVTDIKMRMAEKKDGPVITEGGHVILDVTFDNIDADAEKDLKGIPGVVETGLFAGYPIEILSV
ncbi:ribose 5-phosphate isomerase A [Salimicrobium halophilum]|uniref:Ribose 5-phosphate isomerase A n=1 Tax=Salimicrobium halophilum TaxID=86666 RepID=A0A1G8SUM6_9BACI|nr:ribose 5-phosphate isomerase A [Salimicrobium halophilum]SDJ32972.1 ribose-5-phosphate isomerase [Salimicrobium halophilum]